jgi:hypothetical protein
LPRRGEFLVHRFHAFNREWACIFDFAVSVRMNDTAWPKVLLKFGIFRVIRIFRFFLSVQVVEVAEELVKAVIGGKELVLVAQVVLPELPGRIAEGLEKFRDTWILRSQTYVCAGDTDLGKSGPDRRLPGDKGCPTGGAALLPIPAGKQRAFIGYPVDIWSLVAHHAAIVTTWVKPPDVITHDDEDVRFLFRLLLRIENARYGGEYKREGGHSPSAQSLAKGG